MSVSTPTEPQVAARQRWMRVLARAEEAALAEAWQGLSDKPAYLFLRPPETGLVMVRGRSGGTGNSFNLGEMSVTRCAVQLDSGAVGISYAAGRNLRHAELAATFDALMQLPERRSDLDDAVITPLEERQRRRRERVSAEAAASRVEFFTMVRGENSP